MYQALINRSNVGSPGNRWTFSPSDTSLRCSYCNKLGNIRAHYLTTKRDQHMLSEDCKNGESPNVSK